MSEAEWEIFDALFKTVHRQGCRIASLEERVESLLRESASRTREAEAFGERPVLKLAEPDQSHLCPDCTTYHSPELPCPTPVNEAWVKFGDKEVAA